jgi:hypothetical protein
MIGGAAAAVYRSDRLYCLINYTRIMSMERRAGKAGNARRLRGGRIVKRVRSSDGFTFPSASHSRISRPHSCIIIFALRSVFAVLRIFFSFSSHLLFLSPFIRAEFSPTSIRFVIYVLLVYLYISRVLSFRNSVVTATYLIPTICR